MSNTWIQPSIVAKEALIQLENELVMGRLVHRDYENEFKTDSRGWKVGSSITIKAPVYFRVKDGATLDNVDLREEDITFTVDSRKHVAFTITSSEMTQDIDKFSKRFIKPAMQALANHVDTTLLGLYTDVPNQVGTPGTTPADWLTYGQAMARLDEEACPVEGRVCVQNPQAKLYLADYLKGLFHTPIVDKAIRKGFVTDAAGFDLYMSQNVNTHTCGTWAGITTFDYDDTFAEGDTTLNIDQAGAGAALTAKHGDIFTIADVNSVNPISGISTGQVRQFVVDADATFADAGGGDFQYAMTCTPGTAPYTLYTGSASEVYLPYQNLSAAPVNNAALTIAGTASLVHPVNLAFHKDAFGLAMCPLETPASVSRGATMSYNGYSIRVIRDYDVTNDQEKIRFDILYGVKTLNPFLACRVAG